MSTVEHRVPEKVQRKRQRKGLPRSVRWHKLVIDPLSSRVRYDKKARGGEDIAGVHIVPGQLRHYGNCCPGRHEAHGLLFGKIEGRVWVPMHVRGNPEHGVSGADYEVRTS